MEKRKESVQRSQHVAEIAALVRFATAEWVRRSYPSSGEAEAEASSVSTAATAERVVLRLGAGTLHASFAERVVSRLTAEPGLADEVLRFAVEAWRSDRRLYSPTVASLARIRGIE